MSTTSEIKKVLRPLIKECIKEILFETDGVFSRLIKETVSALTESVEKPKEEVFKSQIERKKAAEQKLNESRTFLAKAIGNDAYKDIFTNVAPIAAEVKPAYIPGTKIVEPTGASPLSGLSPDDPGVDISGIMSFIRK